jgi:hypothetical protein
MNAIVPSEAMSSGFLAPVSNQGSAAGNAVVARAVQEVQGAIISAKMYPRNQGQALKNIEGSCTRIKLAETAMYSYTRGGSEVTGPSIRLAEVIAQNWGNLQFGWVITAQTASTSDVTAFCWDMETNVRRAIEFKVNHVRDTKKGPVHLTAERDIYELCANMASRRVRNCILSVVPSDIVDAAVEACESTLANAGDIEKRRNEMVKAFSDIGVTADDIEKRFGKKVSAISSVDFVQLRKIFQSIKDGMSEISDWFEQTHQPEMIKNEMKAAVAEDNKKAKTKNHAAMVKLVNDRIVALSQRGVYDGDILEAMKVPAKSLGDVNLDTFSENQLAAMGKALQAL